MANLLKICELKYGRSDKTINLTVISILRALGFFFLRITKKNSYYVVRKP